MSYAVYTAWWTGFLAANQMKQRTFSVVKKKLKQRPAFVWRGFNHCQQLSSMIGASNGELLREKPTSHDWLINKHTTWILSNNVLSYYLQDSGVSFNSEIQRHCAKANALSQHTEKTKLRWSLLFGLWSQTKIGQLEESPVNSLDFSDEVRKSSSASPSKMDNNFGTF